MVPPSPPARTIDISKIILPRKNAPSVDSAQRINAGALLEQEQHATLPKTEKVQAPSTPPAAAIEGEGVKSLETYQGDIESLVQDKNISVVAIAAAEAARRGTVSLQGSAASASTMADIQSLLYKIATIGAGLILVAGAVGLLVWILRPAPSVTIGTAQESPFINVDDTKVLTAPKQNLSHVGFVEALNQQRGAVSLSLGLIARLYVVESSSTPQGTEVYTPFTTSRMLGLLDPQVPEALVRSLNPTVYLLGVHSYDENQSFLILRADSYEAAYAGMLAWERTMQQSLSPLFKRTPNSHLPAQEAATSTATSTPQLIQTGFIDRIVENHDARVILDDTKELLLLWTFLDRKTILVTTNDATLREIISRLKNPSIVPLP